MVFFGDLGELIMTSFDVKKRVSVFYYTLGLQLRNLVKGVVGISKNEYPKDR